MVFPSKVDAWVPAAAIGIPVVTLGTILFASSTTEGSIEPALLATAIVLVVVTLVAWLFVSTKYTVDHDLLTISSGPFRWRIPIRDIESVTPSSSPLSSPALSMDRLQIHYRGGNDILVSPDDKQGFIASLVAVNGAIRVER